MEDFSAFLEASSSVHDQPHDQCRIRNVKNLMQNLRQLNGTVLIDAPGNLAQQGLIPLFVHSDYIVCPYHGSGAMTRSPSPLAWRPDFPGAPREAH